MSFAPVDHRVRAQDAAERRLALLNELLDLDPDDARHAELTALVVPASVGYCGCTTCDVRETLVAAWPHLLDEAATQAD